MEGPGYQLIKGQREGKGGEQAGSCGKKGGVAGRGPPEERECCAALGARGDAAQELGMSGLFPKANCSLNV